MSGDDWQQFAGLRAYYAFMWGWPGKKLLFMGQEFGQWNEWNHDDELDWNLLAFDAHRQLQTWVKVLNTLYRNDGGNTFTELDVGLQGMYRGSAHWGDFDNDGRVDILLAGSTNPAAAERRRQNCSSAGCGNFGAPPKPPNVPSKL